MRVVTYKERFALAGAALFSANFAKLVRSDEVIKGARLTIDSSYDTSARVDPDTVYAVLRAGDDAVSMGVGLLEEVEVGATTENKFAFPLFMSQNKNITSVFVFENMQLDYRIVDAHAMQFDVEFDVGMALVDSCRIYVTLYLE